MIVDSLAKPMVGIVGCGRMGANATRRLIDSSFPVTVANRTMSRAAALAESSGCQLSPSFKHLGERSDVVLVLTSGVEGTRSALVGDDGVLAGAREGTLVVVMSTVTRGLIQELHEIAWSGGVDLIDAPISGRPTELATGDVSILVGGSAESVQRASDVLSVLGAMLHVGPVGAAAAMKLSVNTVVFGLLAAIAECIALASRAGVDPVVAYDVLQASAVGSKFVDLRREFFVNDVPPAVQFSMGAARENLLLIESTASELGLTMPQVLTNLATVKRAIAAGMSEDDVTQLGRLLVD